MEDLVIAVVLLVLLAVVGLVPFLALGLSAWSLGDSWLLRRRVTRLEAALKEATATLREPEGAAGEPATAIDAVEREGPSEGPAMEPEALEVAPDAADAEVATEAADTEEAEEQESS